MLKFIIVLKGLFSVVVVNKKKMKRKDIVTGCRTAQVMYASIKIIAILRVDNGHSISQFYGKSAN